MTFIEWALGLPLHIKILVYALIGVLIGINYRFFFARHLWVKHQSEERPEKGSCWCKVNDYAPLLTLGDLVSVAIWTAPFLWPIHFPIALIVLVFKSYSAILRFFHGLAQKGAKRLFLDLQTEKELRERLEEVTKFYEGEKRERQRYAGLRDECEKTISTLRGEIDQLKAKKPDDVRFEELMDRSAKLLDRAGESGDSVCVQCNRPFTQDPTHVEIRCADCRKAI